MNPQAIAAAAPATGGSSRGAATRSNAGAEEDDDLGEQEAESRSFRHKSSAASVASSLPTLDQVYANYAKDDVDASFEVTNPLSREASGRRIEDWEAAALRKANMGAHVPEAYRVGAEVGAVSTLDAEHFLAMRQTRGQRAHSRAVPPASIPASASEPSTAASVVSDDVAEWAPPARMGDEPEKATERAPSPVVAQAPLPPPPAPPSPRKEQQPPASPIQVPRSTNESVPTSPLEPLEAAAEPPATHPPRDSGNGDAANDTTAADEELLRQRAEAARLDAMTEIEGALLKKTKNGRWNSRRFKLVGKDLIWLRSDNKTPNKLPLTPKTEIRDVKFGVRKFAFDVVTENDELNLAASGQAEKDRWMLALRAATGALAPGEMVRGRASLHELAKRKGNVGKVGADLGATIIKGMTSAPPPQAAQPSSPLPGESPPSASPNGGDGGGHRIALALPMLASKAANDRLMEKLRGAGGGGDAGAGALDSADAPETCAKCREPVYTMDLMAVDGVVLHKRCFRCEHCDRTLTLDAFEKSPRQGSQAFYCRTHYHELFDAKPEDVGAGGGGGGGGALDNSAALSRARIQPGRRRAPSVMPPRQALPEAVDVRDRAKHPFTFRVSLDGSLVGPNVLWVHATSQVERDHWVETLGAAVHALELKRRLEAAQKVDMMAALRAKSALDAFVASHRVTYEGFLEKLSLKSNRNWKRRFFELTEEGELRYSESDRSKAPKHKLKLSFATVIFDVNGTRTNAPVQYESVASPAAGAGSRKR